MRHDWWFALRRLRLRPGHSLAVALTLGLGIGASLAVFHAVDAVLLRPVPYPDADRLVRVTQIMPVDRLPDLNFSDVGYRRLATDSRTLHAAAAYDTRDANLVRGDATTRLIVARVTRSLFSVLRVQPALGRAFTTDEDALNGPRVIALSDRLWRTEFAADTSIIGRSVNLEGRPYSVVAVLQPSTAFPSKDVDAWEPLQLDPAAANPFQNAYSVIGRLRDGVTLGVATRDFTEPIRAVGREYPGPHPGSALDPSGYSARVQPLARVVVGDTRAIVALLGGGVVTLLLLTCANVANLQLAAAIERREDIAIQAALGASRSRLIRGALIEGLMLASLGAVVGSGVATIGTELIAAIIPPSVALAPSTAGIRMVAMTAAIVVVVGGLVGALPMIAQTRRAPGTSLREQHGGHGASATRLRRTLAAAQVAFAVFLLHSSGLLLVSAVRVGGVQLGFRPEQTVSIRINIPNATLRDRAAREGLLRRIVRDIGALPGVTAAGVANALPLTTTRRDLAMAVEGRPFKADGTDPVADFRIVSGGYFAAMGIAVTRGRAFTDDDATDRTTPLMINETLARQLFDRGTDPVGQRLRFGPFAPWMPIVAVVADAKNRGVTELPRPELYTPALGTFSTLSLRSGATIVVRAGGDAMSLAGPIRRIIAAAGPNVAAYQVQSLTDIVRQSRARITSATRLISAYAAAALLIAIAGTYAVLAHLVAQRRHELAVRIALGAPAGSIAMLVARESGALAGVGVVIGLVGAIAAARLLGALLFGVSGGDVRVLLGVASLMVIACAAAAAIPVRRALAANPAESLRSAH